MMRSRSKSRSTIRNFTRQSIPTTCRSSSARQRDAASGAEAISAPCSLSDDGLQKPRRDLVASFWVTNGKQNDGVPSDKSLEATATNGAAHPATSRAMPAILSGIGIWQLASWRNIAIALTTGLPVVEEIIREWRARRKKRPLPKCWSGHSYEIGTFLYLFAARIFAHLALCAAAILFLPAADILRRALARVAFFAPPSSRCNT